MNFAEQYNIRKQETENKLHELTETFSAYPKVLGDAMAYSLTSGGKRLRPILLLEAVRVFGGEVDEAANRFALAIECVHTYSLIHDDLPCMDNDDFRRGAPTCHRKFGVANALLAGDALLNLAYELSLSAVEISGGKSGHTAAAKALANAAGANGMVGGQVCDLINAADADAMDYIYSHKTAALIGAALKIGALIANADGDFVEKIEKAGELFGYAFQLSDDLLDKDTECYEKQTYVSLHGVEKTEKSLAEMTYRAIELLRAIPGTEFLCELIARFMERKS